ncbi:MAG: lytic murein transglycosylase B [Cellvibrionaceae bacterium]|nr:lytic murein transglycosylase B [Cellvibrionaceae bacterium]
MNKFILTCLLLAYSCTSLGQPYQQRPAVKAFIAEMVKEHNFDASSLTKWFAQAEKKQTILDAISRPAEKTKTWAEYRNIFVTDSRIKLGLAFWQENKAFLLRAEQKFGVPAEIIVAIIGVETRYGKNKGSFRVIDALSTLAFDYPPRATFFRKELKEFFLLAREQQQDPLSLMGSYAGAMGYGQFIPSSYRAYAIDFNQDQFADIWNNTEDAIGSVANYFKRHGWRSDEAVAVRSRVAKNYDQTVVNRSLKPSASLGDLIAKGFTPLSPLNKTQAATAMQLEGQWGPEFWLGLHNFYVITRYNHSRLYAMAVWQLSQEILLAKTETSAP